MERINCVKRKESEGITMNSENNKKQYKKPAISSNYELAGLVPLAAAIGPAAALVGAYAAARGVKQMFENKVDMRDKNLLCVIE